MYSPIPWIWDDKSPCRTMISRVVENWCSNNKSILWNYFHPNFSPSHHQSEKMGVFRYGGWIFFSWDKKVTLCVVFIRKYCANKLQKIEENEIKTEEVFEPQDICSYSLDATKPVKILNSLCKNIYIIGNWSPFKDVKISFSPNK